MGVPSQPKIFHILHVDRLASILTDKFILSDSEVSRLGKLGTTIGISEIKDRRLKRPLSTHPSLYVGDCVPFYFCPRSVMLYVICMRNHPALAYRDGQDPIIHLQADLNSVVAWAQEQERKWAFTLSNAGSLYFDDRNDLEQLKEIDWTAVEARDWRELQEKKQAEFLLESSFPWHLVEYIGVNTRNTLNKVKDALTATSHRPPVQIISDWYY